jgi:hypothetical protein
MSYIGNFKRPNKEKPLQSNSREWANHASRMETKVMVCKTIIEFSTNRNISHQVSTFAKRNIGSSQSTLTIMKISMMCCSPLHNAFCTWEILQNIKPLCRHVHDKWEISSEPIAKLWLHKSQSKEIFFVFHITYYLHHD